MSNFIKSNSNKKAFTLLEVLISIMLLSLVLMALYRSADILRASNKNLFKHLEHSSDSIKGANCLYMDLLQSDNNITINTKKKFHKISIESTQHSLYGLYFAKVVWLIYKKDNTLLRIEGNNFKLPLKSENNVAIDTITNNIELFKAYSNKKNGKIIVIIKKVGEDTQSFMVQSLHKIKTKIKLVSPGILSNDRNKIK